MMCKQFENQILDYSENQLSAADRTRVETHLADCADCRAFAQQLQQLDARLTRTVRSPRLSPSFRAKLQQRIQMATVLSPAEIAARKRKFQAEYEAGLAKLTLFPKLPHKLIELFGFAALLTVAGGLVWLMIPPSTIVASVMQLSAPNQQLLFLCVAGAVPVGAGLMLAFPQRNRQLWTWLHPAGRV